MRRLVLGTAGHVDHGKTSLIKALTGTDTDRWEEEKRRGITIDLGFAELQVGDVHLSIVDVPGHEDFVRNMVAGATGIDMALLVIAADEGIMPQTEEHLAILDFLRVPVGIPVITKIDLSEDEWTELVVADVAGRLAETSISWTEPVLVSSETGAGLDDLKQLIVGATRVVEQPGRDELFRMPVDRSFTVAGTGTVVTGTVWSGRLGQGDEVRVIPGNFSSRVRAIQVHGETTSEALPATRTAIALSGLDRDKVPRGSVVVTDGAWQDTSVLDVWLDLLPGAKTINQRSRVRVHIGTAEVMARVTPAAGPVVGGGQGGVRLRLESPLVARWGDLGVIRSYSPVATVGGFVVVDPCPPSRPRRPLNLEAKKDPDPGKRLGAFLDTEAEVRLVDLELRMGLTRDGVRPGTIPDHAMNVGSIIISVSEAQSRISRAAEKLDRFHRANPLLDGMPLDEFRALLGRRDVADGLIDVWKARGTLLVSGGTAARKDFTPAPHGKLADLEGRIKSALVSSRFNGATLGELSEFGNEQDARAVAEYLVRTGVGIRVGAERYYDASVMNELVGIVLRALQTGDAVGPAELRDVTGLSRKYLIPLLEWTDQHGLTRRDGDVRRIGPEGRRLVDGDAVDKA